MVSTWNTKMQENYRNKDEKLTLNTKNRRNKENANKGNLQTRVKTSGEHDEKRLLNANQPKTSTNMASTFSTCFRSRGTGPR